MRAGIIVMRILGRYGKMHPTDISGLYQSLVQQKIHQDQLLWSRIQTLQALQAAVIGGGFAAHFSWDNSLLGGWWLVIGGVVSLCILFLVLGDYADMKINDSLMKELAGKLLPSHPQGSVQWVDEKVWHRSKVRGHYMIYAIIVVLILVDFVVGALMLCGPSILG